MIGLVAGSLLFAFLCLLGSGLLKFTWTHRDSFRFQARLFLIAFVVRFLFSLAVYEFGLLSVLKDEDSNGWIIGTVMYHKWIFEGVSLIDMPRVLLGAYSGQHLGYRYMLGSLFFFTDGPSRMAAAVLNCFFGALTVVFAYRIARTLFSESVAIRVGWWTCYIPSLIVWSAQTVKEPVVILLETIALYSCVQLKKCRFSIRHVLLCALTILIVTPFRFYVAYIVAASILFSLFVPDFSARRMNLGHAISTSLLVMPLLMGSWVLARREAKFNEFDAKFIANYRHNVAEGSGSGYETHYDVNTTQGMAMATLVGGVHLLLAPFPWQLLSGNLRKIMTAPEQVVWWWLFVWGVVPGLWYTVRKRFGDVQPLVFFLVTLGLLYAVTFGNVGLAYRQRAQLMPWLLIFAMVGLEERRLRRAQQRYQLYVARPRPGTVPAQQPATGSPLGNQTFPAAPDPLAPS